MWTIPLTRPVSEAMQTALNAKQAIVDALNAVAIKGMLSLNNVDNTPDV